MCPLTACTLNLNQVVSARGSSVGGIRALLQHLFPPSLFFLSLPPPCSHLQRVSVL